MAAFLEMYSTILFLIWVVATDMAMGILTDTITGTIMDMITRTLTKNTDMLTTQRIWLTTRSLLLE